MAVVVFSPAEVVLGRLSNGYRTGVSVAKCLDPKMSGGPESNIKRPIFFIKIK